jgi:trimethylamine:corrinoid methyltransferase-like protein
LVSGVESSYSSFAIDAFAKAGLSGEFLKLPETRKLFRQEQHIPSSVIDRASRQDGAQKDALSRAADRVEELVAQYRMPEIGGSVLDKFQEILERESGRRCAKSAAGSR